MAHCAVKCHKMVIFFFCSLNCEFSFTFVCKNSCICNFAIFVRIFMKFSPICWTKKFGVFAHFWIGKGANFNPKWGLEKYLHVYSLTTRCDIVLLLCSSLRLCWRLFYRCGIQCVFFCSNATCSFECPSLHDRNYSWHSLQTHIVTKWPWPTLHALLILA